MVRLDSRDGDFAADRLAAKVGSYPTVDPLGAPYA